MARHDVGRRNGGPDAGRADGTAGLEGRLRRLAAGRRLGTHGRAGTAGRGARLRVAVGLRPLPHRAGADRRDHVRVVLGARGAGDGDDARAARAHGRLHRLPQPGAHGQAVIDARRHQRRPVRAGHRRRLEGRRVARLRLRLPVAGRPHGGARRPPRGHQRDARARPLDVRGSLRPRPRRDQRAAGPPGAAHPDHRRRQRAPDGRPATRSATRTS